MGLLALHQMVWRPRIFQNALATARRHHPAVGLTSMARRLRIPFRFIPIPAVIFEEWLPSGRMSLNELQCYAFICRQTYGLSKPPRVLMTSQFVKHTGLSRRTVQRSISRLIDKHLVRVTGSPRKPRLYEVLMPHDIQIQRATMLAH